MAAPVNDGSPPLPSLETALALLHEKMPNYVPQNIYLFGSRLHRRARPDSDCDFIVLVDGPVFFVEAVSVASEELGIEMSVFHQEYFKELLKQGVIYAIIVPFYPKNEFAWLEKIDLQPYVNDIEYYAMRQMLKTELDFKWKKCKHLWSTGDFIVPPKIASHVIRYILHAIDLATKGNIPDFTYGNEWWDAVRSEHFNQWEDCESKYRPIADKFMAKLDAISTAIDDFLEYETTVEAQWQAAKASSGSPTMRLVLFDFIAKHGFAGLKRENSIAIRPHPLHPRLLLLRADYFNSSTRLRVAQECNGILVEADTSSSYVVQTARLVAMPLHKVYLYTDEMPFDWNRFRAYTHADGAMVMLYRYADEWHLSSYQTPDADDRDIRSPIRPRVRYNPYQVRLPLVHTFSKQTVTTSSVFWRIWKSHGYHFPDPNEGLSYMFKVSAPELCKYRPTSPIPMEQNIELLAVRSTATAEEFFPEPTAMKYGWKCSTYLAALTSKELVMSHLDKLDPFATLTKGLLVVDSRWRRYKLPATQIALLKELCTGNDKFHDAKIFMEILRRTSGRMFTRLPQWTPFWAEQYKEQETRYTSLCTFVSDSLREIMDKAKDDAEFDKMVPTLPSKSLMGLVRNTKYSHNGSVPSLLAVTPLKVVNKLIGELQPLIDAHIKKKCAADNDGASICAPQM